MEYIRVTKDNFGKNRNVSIQMFRILACLGVFFVHFGQRVSLDGVIRNYTDFGAFGVQMFFIISGLLAAKGLYGKNDVLGYYKKRFINIAPLYYIVILWYFITENILEMFWPHIPADTAGLGWLRYLFMLNGFVTNDTYFWSNLGITWTIPIFAFFYLIAPFIMRIIKNYKSALVALVIVFAVFKGAGHLYSCPIFDNIYYFFMGILVYFCWCDQILMPCALGFLIIAIGEAIIDILSCNFCVYDLHRT